jgi:hypothetical protein
LPLGSEMTETAKKLFLITSYTPNARGVRFRGFTAVPLFGGAS